MALAKLLLLAFPAFAQYDLAIVNGRVMDPESGLDAVRNVAIKDGKIAAITTRAVTAKKTIDAKGHVVAPGFIDLHSHGLTNAANEFQAHDGVTTALELEVGVSAMKSYLDTRAGKALLNYGATISHAASRGIALKEIPPAKADVIEVGVGLRGDNSRNMTVTKDEEFSQLAYLLEKGLKEGALGIGVVPAYLPGATRTEVFKVYQMAARWKVPIFTHIRGRGEEGVQEAIANAIGTGASVHIVHLNSSSRGAVLANLEMIAGARKRGIDVTTEAYPYTAGSTFIESALFDDGWQQQLGVTYNDLQWQATGERLTKETFEKYRKQGGILILHSMKPEWIKQVLASPFVMIASDTMPYAAGAHPRGGGTFSKVLGEYVRELKVATLMEAIRRMTLLPAQRLEPLAPQMKNKGRIKVGADADITVFDAATVRDTGTYQTGPKFAEGIPHVIVNGVVVVENGKTVPNVFPGTAVRGIYGVR
ncbi:MAG: amidohydrolase family protein [Acidobacteria bacterium]|nr:amidohydrolase family protein [Acidobacteriota bacterium]